jgi:transcriptional regulator with XRE-family HTH domain
VNADDSLSIGAHSKTPIGKPASTQPSILASNRPIESLEGPELEERKRLERLLKRGLVVPFTDKLKVTLNGRQLDAFRKAHAWTFKFLEHELKLKPNEGKALTKNAEGLLPLKVVEKLYEISAQAPVIPRSLSGRDILQWREGQKLDRRQAALELGTEMGVIRKAEQLGGDRLPEDLASRIPFLNRIIIDSAIKDVPPNFSMTGRQLEEQRRIRGLSKSELTRQATVSFQTLNSRINYDTQFPENVVSSIRPHIMKHKIISQPPMPPSDLDRWLGARGWSTYRASRELGQTPYYLESHQNAAHLRPLSSKVVQMLSKFPPAIDIHLTGEQFLSLRLARGWKTPEEAAKEYGTSTQMVEYAEALGPEEIPPELALLALTHPAPANFPEAPVTAEVVPSDEPHSKAISGNQLAGWLLVSDITPEAFAKQLGISVRNLRKLTRLDKRAIPEDVAKKVWNNGFELSRLDPLRVLPEHLRQVKPPHAMLDMFANQAGLSEHSFYGYYYNNLPLPLNASIRLRKLYPSLPLWAPPALTGHHLALWRRANRWTPEFAASVLRIPVAKLERLELLESKELPKRVAAHMTRRREVTPAAIGQTMSSKEIFWWIKDNKWSSYPFSVVFGVGSHMIRRIAGGRIHKQSTRVLSHKIRLLEGNASTSSSIGILPAETMTGARFRFWRTIRGLSLAEMAKELGEPEKAVAAAERDGLAPIPWKAKVDALSKKLPIVQPAPLTWNDVKFWRQARGLSLTKLAKRVGSSAMTLSNYERGGSTRVKETLGQLVMSSPIATDAHVTGDELLAWRLKYGRDARQAAEELETSEEMIVYSEALGASEIFPELALRMLTHPGVSRTDLSLRTDVLTGGQLAKLLPFLNLKPFQFAQMVGVMPGSVYVQVSRSNVPVPRGWVAALREWAQQKLRESPRNRSRRGIDKHGKAARRS